MTKIEKFLTKNSEPDYAKFNQKLIDTKYQIRGVRLPKLKKFAKEITPEEIDLKSACHETILLYGFSASNFKTEAEQLKCLKNLIPYIDNWGTCDCIVCALKRLNGEDSYKFFSNLLKDNRQFYVRVGIIGLMRNFLKTEKLDEILESVRCLSQNEYYVKMAIAWMYAELCTFNFEKTKAEIKQTSDKFIRNKAISKSRESFRVTAQQKEELAKLRI